MVKIITAEIGSLRIISAGISVRYTRDLKNIDKINL